MGDNTKIEWADASWPIVNGCRRVSEWCRNCYAERLIATRLRNVPKYAGLAEMRNGDPRWTGKSRLWREHLDWPLRWTRPRRVFVADMGDLFYEGVSDSDIAAVFGVMAACPRHTFQVLMKRPGRVKAWLDWVSPNAREVCYVHADEAFALDGHAEWSHCRTTLDRGTEIDGAWPLPNVHLGVSVEDQATADERIPILLRCPAALHWVSAEPLLEAVDLARFMWPVHQSWPLWYDTPADARAAGVVLPPRRQAFVSARACFVKWLVVGGESGPSARPFDLAWARSAIAQCREAGVPCFVKQLGSRPFNSGRPSTHRDTDSDKLFLRDRKGGDLSEWPVDLRVRELPATTENNDV